MDPTTDPIVELLTSYRELNTSRIEELDEEPSPLEFMRYVARNTPFVVRGGSAHEWQAAQRWDAAYLRAAMEGQTVNVAVTPHGNADAPTLEPGSGEVLFAKPHEEDQDFGEFLAYVRGQALEGWGGEVRYAQTQNDNFRHEYQTLFGEVPRDIAFARIALEKEPDAVNLWIGNARSVTAMHRDNYENIYVQIAGQKHFVLMPALCQPCINEKELVPATYSRKDDQSLELRRDEPGTEDAGAEEVPFATWDPDKPDKNTTSYSHLAEPMRVTLNPGDMLYLPAMWYHKVSQSCSEEGICVAANYWYDMEFSGPLYSLCSFVRNLGNSR
ncbi:phospholipase A2 [Xylariaceae sp. FL0016]|nr:phospholipase A2 [Xylariaceae sp. FL0016]